MAKLYLFAALVLISAVFVAARNAYQKDDANIDEEIRALMRVLQDRATPTKVSDDASAGGGKSGNSKDTDEDGEIDDFLADCMDSCKVNEPEELCNCTNIECVPEDCPSQREVGDVDEDNDGDLDEEDGEKRILGALKRWFWGKRKRYYRYHRYYRYRNGKK